MIQERSTEPKPSVVEVDLSVVLTVPFLYDIRALLELGAHT